MLAGPRLIPMVRGTMAMAPWTISSNVCHPCQPPGAYSSTPRKASLEAPIEILPCWVFVLSGTALPPTDATPGTAGMWSCCNMSMSRVVGLSSAEDSTDNHREELPLIVSRILPHLMAPGRFSPNVDRQREYACVALLSNIGC